MKNEEFEGYTHRIGLSINDSSETIFSMGITG